MMGAASYSGGGRCVWWCLRGPVVWTCLIFLFLFDCADASELSKALEKASRFPLGGKDWHESLSAYVADPVDGALGRLKSSGQDALIQEFQELNRILASQQDMELNSALSLCEQYVASRELFDRICLFGRWSRVVALVGHMEAMGTLKSTFTLYRCERLCYFILHHAVVAEIRQAAEEVGEVGAALHKEGDWGPQESREENNAGSD